MSEEYENLEDDDLDSYLDDVKTTNSRLDDLRDPKPITKAASEVFEGDFVSGKRIQVAEMGLNMAMLGVGAFHSKRLNRLLRALDTLEEKILDPDVLETLSLGEAMTLTQYIDSTVHAISRELKSIKSTIDWESFPTQVDLVYNSDRNKSVDEILDNMKPQASQILRLVSEHQAKTTRITEKSPSQIAAEGRDKDLSKSEDSESEE